MKRNIKRMLLMSSIALFIVAFAVSPYAAEYPTRPITLLVAFPAGAATDVGARILAAESEKEMGQPIIVVNKGGAGGQVGWTELASQKPDGYYLGFINLPNLNSIILDPDRKATFNLDSFVPIINQVVDPGVIWVRADSPYKTLKDLLDDAKKRPGEISCSTTGIFGDDHLGILKMEEAARVKFRAVHFDGGATMIPAVLGGQVDVSFDNVTNIVHRVKSGQIRALAVMDGERSKFLPDVPTTVELGYPTVSQSVSRGIVGPKGIPAAVLKKIQGVFINAMKAPGYIEKMEKVSLEIKPMVGDEYGKYIKCDHDQTKPLLDAARKLR